MPYKDPQKAKEAARLRYLARQQERIEYARRQRAEQGEEINARRRKRYAQRSPEWHAEYLKYQQAWHAAHPGYAKQAARKHRQANPEAVRAYQLAWQRQNREAIAAYGARRRGAAVGMTADDKRESIEWRKAIASDPCFYCGSADAEAYEDDHYVSVANGGTDHWWNLVRACQPCNRAKRAMNGDEFLASIALVLLIKGPLRQAPVLPIAPVCAARSLSTSCLPSSSSGWTRGSTRSTTS